MSSILNVGAGALGVILGLWAVVCVLCVVGYLSRMADSLDVLAREARVRGARQRELDDLFGVKDAPRT